MLICFNCLLCFSYITRNIGTGRTCSQCCGSRMIHSGSSYEFLEFRIQFQPILFKHIWKILKKKRLKFNQKKKTLSIWHFLFQTTVLQYTQSRINRPKIINQILLISSFIFSWIRIRNNNSGYGSREKFGIHNTAVVWIPVLLSLFIHWFEAGLWIRIRMDPHGSAFIFPPGSGSAFNMRILIQEGKFVN